MPIGCSVLCRPREQLGRSQQVLLCIRHEAGGRIFVYSELGRGTVFRVYLPLVDAPLATPNAPASEATPTGRELVLLVEDDPPLRAAVARMLTSRGYRVLLAKDGRKWQPLT